MFKLSPDQAGDLAASQWELDFPRQLVAPLADGRNDPAQPRPVRRLIGQESRFRPLQAEDSSQ
jgi:hypothetical protein